MFDLFLISLFVQNIVLQIIKIQHVENNKQYTTNQS